MRFSRIALLFALGFSATLFAADIQFEGKTLSDWEAQAQSGTEAARYSAIQTCAKARDKAAVPILCAILLNKDESRNLRYESAEALGDIADPSSAASLLTALKDTDEHLRIWTIRALGVTGIGNPDVKAALAQAQTSDSSAKVREKAAAALKQIAEIEAQIDQQQTTGN